MEADRDSEDRNCPDKEQQQELPHDGDKDCFLQIFDLKQWIRQTATRLPELLEVALLQQLLLLKYAGHLGGGQMAVLEKAVAVENAIHAELLKEHAVRVWLLQEDHDYMMLERVDKRKHENQVRELEVSKQKNELEKQVLEIEILQIEKELKKEQLRRL
ncbi:hypothetical protein MRX96_027273 [Rhipicephalus microplus]